MQHRPYTYLFWIQYLGYRYHGWQKQPNLKTIQGRLERVIRYVLDHENFTILAAGRTDSGVSCQRGAFELFNISSIDIPEFIKVTNNYLPDDIKLLSGQEVGSKFNIIQDVVAKEYRYYFSNGEKIHPFVAGNIVWINTPLDIEQMQVAATFYQGTHDFRRFCTKGKNTENFIRTIYHAYVGKAEEFNGHFYPDEVYYFCIKGSGFLMHQVRIMVEALFQVGKGELEPEAILLALSSEKIAPIGGKAPAHGLMMHEVIFNEEKL